MMYAGSKISLVNEANITKVSEDHVHTQVYLRNAHITLVNIHSSTCL